MIAPTLKCDSATLLIIGSLLYLIVLIGLITIGAIATNLIYVYSFYLYVGIPGFGGYICSRI